MNSIIEQMLDKYTITTINDEINALKEIIQEIIICGLSRGDFFNEAELILKFFPQEKNNPLDRLLKNIKIKFEIDVNPPSGATYEEKDKLLPSPHRIKLYDKESLFAGKIHAILCRNWKTRTKGRDLYDFIFFIATNTKVNLELLKNKLIESKYINEKDKFDVEILKKLLTKKFKEISFEDAKEDVIPFIKDTTSLNLWNYDFFINLLDELN